MSTISPLSGIPPTRSSTAEGGGRGNEYQPRRGQSFKATVVEARGNNTFILDIGGNRLAAQARNPLSIGQTLQLQVMTTSPQVELRIVSDSANLFAGRTITLLGENIDIQTLVASLRNTSPSALASLNSFSRQTLESYLLLNQESLAGREGGALLKQLIDRLGLSFENLLARGDAEAARTTLKAALLEMTQLFKSADQLAESTHKLLGTLELYQLAQLQLDRNNLFLFPLPLPFLEKGYLLVERDGGGSGEEEMSEEKRFSLHLTLSGLGNLRIDILKSPEGLYIRFRSDSSDALTFLEQFKEDLLPGMLDSPLLGVSFSREQIDPAADLLKRLLPEGESLVNTKV